MEMQSTAGRAAENGGFFARQVAAVEKSETKYTVERLLGHLHGAGPAVGFLDEQSE